MIRRQDGLTLLELLLAMAVFSLVGAMAYSGLNSMLNQSEIVAENRAALEQLGDAVALFESDLRQHAARPVRGLDGRMQASLQGNEQSLWLTRAGFAAANPDSPRVGRVGWERRGAVLQRQVQDVLDAAPSTRPRLEPILDNIVDLRFGYRDSIGELHRRWPSDQAGGELVAIELELQTERFGRIRRLILISPTSGAPTQVGP